MAAGVPVVASAIPALAEVGGPAALLVPPSDAASWAAAMLTASGYPAAASGMIAAGAALAAAATWETGGRRSADPLFSVAASASPGRAVARSTARWWAYERRTRVALAHGQFWARTGQARRGAA